MPDQLPTVTGDMGAQEATPVVLFKSIADGGGAVDLSGIERGGSPSEPQFVSGAPVGITASASFTPTASPYAAGDIIDTAKEFAFTYADGSPIPAGSLIRILTAIVKIDVAALQASEAAYQLRCYAVTPPSGRADNAAWTRPSGDLASYRGPISLGTPAADGGTLYVKSPNIDLDIKLTGTSLFNELQTLSGFNATAVARQVLLYGIVL